MTASPDARGSSALVRSVWHSLRGVGPLAYLAGSILLVVLVLIWLRTGLYPAASAADDAWFSEAGYYFLHEGVLRRPWLDGPYGGAFRDFFPPVTSIIQAGSFALFGVNAFGEMAQSSLACTLLALLVVVLARRSGAKLWLALAAGTAIFGLQIVLEQSIRVRAEQWMTIFLLLSVLLQDLAREAGQRNKGLFLSLGAGLSLGISCLAYYPYAPAALATGFIGVSLTSQAERRRWLAVFVGGATMLVLFIIYVSPDWNYFFGQELGTGVFYFKWSNFLVPFKYLWVTPDHGAWQGPVRFRLMAWEAMTVFVVSGLLLRFSSYKPARLHAIRALVMTAPYFILASPTNLVWSGVFLVLAVVASTGQKEGVPRLSRIAVVGIVLAALLGSAKVGAISIIAWVQHDGRDYGAVTARLTELVNEPGRVGVDRVAWLALRPRLGPDDLHWIVQSDYYEDYIWRSKVLRGQGAGARFKYLVLAPNRTLDAIARDYPGFRDDIAAGRWREIGRVSLPFRSLPLARSAPYDLIVYKRSSS